jgi:hypothetical protein
MENPVKIKNRLTSVANHLTFCISARLGFSDNIVPFSVSYFLLELSASYLRSGA